MNTFMMNQTTTANYVPEWIKSERYFFCDSFGEQITGAGVSLFDKFASLFRK